MAWRYALVIDPVASDDDRTDFTDTFTEIDPTAPALTVGELSTQRGDGIFESIGVVAGHAQETAAHLQRLAHSAALCELPAPHIAQWAQAVQQAAGHAGDGESVIKLILSRGVEHGPSPTAWVTVADAADFTAMRRDGIRLVTLDRGYTIDAPARAAWLLLGAKTLSYAVNMAAIREARRRGADDAVFVSSDGFVLEAPTASLILRVDARFITPAPNGSILAGTTQASLFEFLAGRGLPVSEELVPVGMLGAADAAWLVSSVRLAAPVRAIDDRELTVDTALTRAMNDYLLTPRD